MASNKGLLAGLLASAACVAVAPASAAPTYSLVTTIAIPTAGPAINPNAGGTFTAFDISFFDPTTNLNYVGDRSNAGIDIYSAATNTYVGRATGFAGQKATNSISGPDGVLVANNGSTVHQLFGGDGNSTLRSYSLSSPTAPTLSSVTSTGGALRVDEMAYSPTANLVLAANNADAPAFGTLFNASTGAVVKSNIVIPGAASGDGLEQSVWNPATNSFFISVPQFGGAGPGGVAEINTDGTVGRLYKFDAMAGLTACSASGLALGASGDLLVGCGDAGSQTVILDPTGTGKIVKTLSQLSSSDEVYYDPASGNFLATGVDGGSRVIDVIPDATDTVQQSILLPTAGNAHSVSAGDGEIFVPIPAGAANALCTQGCLAVYAVPVAEPASLPVLIPAVLALLGLTVRKRRAHRG